MTFGLVGQQLGLNHVAFPAKGQSLSHYAKLLETVTHFGRVDRNNASQDLI